LSYSGKFDFSGLEVGAYTLGVEVVDNEGHTNAKRIAFRLRR